MFRPRLNSFNKKDAEMFAAADSISLMFKEAHFKSPIAYERKLLSYQAMQVNKRNDLTDSIVRELDNLPDDISLRWGDYKCDISFVEADNTQSVHVDAGIFSLDVYTDKKGHFHIEFHE